MQDIIKILKQNKKLKINLIFVLIIIAISILAPILPIQDPLHDDASVILQPPSLQHLFGTDHMGRDVFARVLVGSQESLLMTFVTVLIIFLIGVSLGLIAGYYGNKIESIIMRIADIMISFPGMMLAISVAGLTKGGIMGASLAIAIVSWPKFARITRSMVVSIKEENYIVAAKLSGNSDLRIMFVHILPNCITTLIVNALTDIGVVLIELASLSFLGFGAQPPKPEWGLMMSEGKTYLQTAPYLVILPGLVIFLVIAIFNYFGDSLNEQINKNEVL